MSDSQATANGRPSHGLSNEEDWMELAHRSWLGSHGPQKISRTTIEEKIWRPLEAADFDVRLLMLLESLQLLEGLWLSYQDESTNHHALLVAFLANTKKQQDLAPWTTLVNDQERFSSLFRRLMSLSLDESLPSTIKIQLCTFFITAFQSLDTELVRKECAPLVSISIWHNLFSESARERIFEEQSQLRKVWRASSKRYEAADEAQKARLRFDRAWLYSLVLDFIARLQRSRKEELAYCERFMELLSDMESQLPTRRYVNTLLKDLNLLAVIQLSPLFNIPQAALLRDHFNLLRHFIYFSIDDSTGRQYGRNEAYELHCKELAKLQRTALKHHKSKLTVLALSNYGSIDRQEDLGGHLLHLDDEELKQFCSQLGLRTAYPTQSDVKVDRSLLTSSLVIGFEGSKPFQDSLRSLRILPTEKSIYDPSLVRNETYDGWSSLAIPKINLQYLSVGDFLWRSFILYRCEQFFEIRKYLEGIVKRLQPDIGHSSEIEFRGFSKMALPVTRPAILETAAPKVGDADPAFVRAEITLNVSRLADGVRAEWESLRPEDTVFLLAVRPAEDHRTNGESADGEMRDSGIKSLRTAEIVQILDETGRPIRDFNAAQTNGSTRRPRIRRLLLNLDTQAFLEDTKAKEAGRPDAYESINLIVRRHQRENNFRKILSTIRSLALSDTVLPSWLLEVYLGFGDPSAAAFTRLAARLKIVDFRDTFIDQNHLLESFPSAAVNTSALGGSEIPPPYVLQWPDNIATDAPRGSRKRRREEDEPPRQGDSRIKVTTYKPPNTGPYPFDRPKSNRIRFTPTQVEAIVSGTQPGLTMIVGPPGTGKTDVVTQVVSNIYHDFPTERTLLIAHSNQALNQLFQKIINLDIDGRHLLRLGQGEGDLETEESFGKYGRVESFMDNRALYLSEVDRLAASLKAPGAHGNSCETAGYFNTVYVQPRWKHFWDMTEDANVDLSHIVMFFPFHDYFSNAPQPLFPQDASKEVVLDVAKGCQRHIDKVFSELNDIRPFEIIRSNKDKTNYLMIKEARIIAMTSTHAAMRRHEIADLGFHYDNVVMEEAAQVTEIETFIPLALQDPKQGSSPLKRVVLCGDHLQNSPIVQNMAFRQFANLEQSLFLRFVRLGVPLINLDAQGRARPSLAELFAWRYPSLTNLPNVLTGSEYLNANAGFQYDYQFINVDDYKGQGEAQPTSHFFQNLGEAEYVVAIFQYMRLLGYPASKVSILTTYAGQRALIRDVLGHRCAGNRLFGMPRIVATVDKYQGEQNDYIILSLVRTSRPGYIRDLRRVTVALSRARLGLYILGRRSVFESTPELASAFALPLARPANLMLTTGELHPTSRQLAEEVDATEMTGVEHLGQHVFNMTQAKVEMLRAGTTQLPPQEPAKLLDVEADDIEVEATEEVIDESEDDDGDVGA